MAIIDGTNLIAGRIATVVAKRALLGETMQVINSDKVQVTGNKKEVLAKFIQRRERRVPLKGPFYPKDPERILRRMIRGMLPYKQEKGKNAFERIQCFVGVPENLKDQKVETIDNANVSKLPSLRYISLKEISKTLGSRVVQRMENLEDN